MAETWAAGGTLQLLPCVVWLHCKSRHKPVTLNPSPGPSQLLTFLVLPFLPSWFSHAGEQHLRLSGVPYTIVRPGWITGTHSGQSRLVAEQGDKATRGGSTSCYDIAAVCCAALTDPDARNVTLELFSRPQHQGGAGAPLAEQLRDVFHGLVPD